MTENNHKEKRWMSWLIVFFLGFIFIYAAGLTTQFYITNIVNDELTGEQTTISTEHSHIHDGDYFIWSRRYTGIAAGDSIYIWFNTTSQAEHLKSWRFSATASPIKGLIYENCTVNQTNKIDLSERNKFKYYNDSSSVGLYRVQEIINNGTRLVTSSIEGSKQSAGSIVGTSEGFHFRHNASYCIELRKLNGNDNTLTVTLIWHHLETEEVKRVLPQSLLDKWF